MARTNYKLNPHVTPTLGIKPGVKVEGGEHSHHWANPATLLINGFSCDAKVNLGT